MGRQHFKTIAAFVSDLFTNRSKSSEGFQQATESSITELAAEADRLRHANQQLEERISALENRPQRLIVGGSHMNA